MRILYVVASLYLILAGASVTAEIWTRVSRPPIERSVALPVARPPGPDLSTPRGWFNALKPRCNSLEVVTAIKRNPPPRGKQGAGYAAACLSLAGRIDRARETIRGLPVEDRFAAAGILFKVGHPVADAGDDESAGPIMELVIEFQPENFMALYHAGMSEFILGQKEKSRANLERFLALYKRDDGWRSNALQTLEKIRSGA